MMLCLIGFLSACSTEPVVITEYETKEVIRNQYVEVPQELTEPVEIVYPKRPETDTIDLIVAYKLQREQAKICNFQLHEIAALKMEETTDGK